MPEKSIIIIGAGIAGLTTGIYGQMNDYKTRIFEMHTRPGGLCTSWERKGYVIDGCLHWLVGTSPKSSYYHMWQEVGALQGEKVIDMEQFTRVETTDGKTVIFYTDVDRLEKHFKEIAPEDSSFIEEFTRAIRHFAGFDIPDDKAPELLSPIDKVRMLSKMAPFMGEFQKWGKLSMKEFSRRFWNSALREAWRMIWPEDFSSVFMLLTLAWMDKKNAGYVIGGSTALALSMEKRYHALGGTISYGSRVREILVESDRAVGVKLENGEEYRADYVVSAADGRTTIWEMLGGRYVDDTIRGYYKMPLFKPLVYIGLGVKRSFTDVPETIAGLVIPLENPLKIGDKEHKRLSVHIYNFDQSLAPDGKTSLTVMFESDFAFWEELSKNPEAYKAEKERIAVAVVSALNRRFPGLANQLEMWDVATPVTFHRYTGNWQGSYEGFLMTAQNMTLQMKKNLPGLSNFYMVGQWVVPGRGLPTGLMTGRHVIQILCKADKKKFQASAPVG
ncbi:MAG: NAD(P)/FAD-dependent oxidoreductase [Dehalococcoidales bacterium]|nr:NAD(P)/FAD-dependent oxidoreductase [Dehalococcoidales bacterium]